MNIATLPNLRELGGHRTADGGTLRSGVLYRSVDLSHLDESGSEALRSLGIQTVFDLRTEQECIDRPDRVPQGVRRVPLDVLGDADDLAPAQLTALLEDPRSAEEVLGGGRAEQLFERAYRSFVALPSARRAYQGLFRGLTTAAEEGAVLFHCTTGKDRTGWAAASLMLLLGVEPDEVMADYLRTNQDLLPALQPIFDAFEQAGGDPEALTPVLGVREAYLAAALDEAHRQFGGIEGYFTQGLDLSEAEIGHLRDALV